MGEFKRRESGSGGRFSRKGQSGRGGFRGRDSGERSERSGGGGFRGRDSGERSERSGGGGFRGRDSGERSERESFEATCDKCGNQCTLPFKPRGGKPVYCSDCFRKNGNSEARGSSNQSADLDKINEKLDKIMRALHID